MPPRKLKKTGPPRPRLAMPPPKRRKPPKKERVRAPIENLFFNLGPYGRTEWTHIEGARDPNDPHHRESTNLFFRRYSNTAYAYFTAHGLGEEDAEDATQTFILYFFQKRGLHRVELRKGKFRAYFYAWLDRFWSDHREYETRIKRGGDATIASLNETDDDGNPLIEPEDRVTPEQAFDRSWATTILEKVRELAERDYQRRHEARIFTVLVEYLEVRDPEMTMKSVGEILGMTGKQVENAIHDLGRLFHGILEGLTRETVSHEGYMVREVHDLLKAVGIE